MKEHHKESRHHRDEKDERRRDDRDERRREERDGRHKEERDDKHKERRHRDDKDHKRKRKHGSPSREPKEKRRRSEKDEYERSPSKSKEVKVELEPMEEDGERGGHEKLSLSIVETNKLRAKLGLKPLKVNEDDNNTSEETSTEKKDVHVPPVNMGDVKKGNELREKLQTMKERRRLEQTLLKAKPLAEEEEEESALAWVEKNRKQESLRNQAEERARVLDQMDEEFGIGSLVEDEFKKNEKIYKGNDLKGLKIEHGSRYFQEGKDVILTLKDKDVLDDGDDVLVNVGMVDDEKAAQNVENRKKKPDYDPYDEPEYDEYGNLKVKEILSKYNEEIHGGSKKDFFVIGGQGRFEADGARISAVSAKLRQHSETLKLPAPVIAGDFYTNEEMVTFKKSSKKVKKSLRKKVKLTADDLLATSLGKESPKKEQSNEENDSERPKMPGFDLLKEKLERVDDDDDDDDDLMGPEEDLTGTVVEEDTAQFELELALNKANKLNIWKRKNDVLNEIVDAIKSEPAEDAAVDLSGNTFYMNSTAEFCRSLGDFATSYADSNPFKDEDDDENAAQNDEDENAGKGWQSVEMDEKPIETKIEENLVLDEEPIIDQGLGAALKLASKKGYLDSQVTKQISAPRHSKLEAQNYSIEDKKMDDLDDKYSGRRNKYSAGGGGPLVEFKEKDGYKPEIKLEYVDDQGREMSKKEAFRYLSHKFHGKGSGKKKLEKRMKKAEEDALMRSMSSTDTPLNTVQLLQEKQKANKLPYVILSGGKGLVTNVITKQ